MIREVDLVSYLPPFMADFAEISATLTAENPEFILVWNASEQVLSNEFIETADEYGISRFEKILNILPSKEDTLESRRSRVQTRWFNTIPYTMKALLAKLETLCDGSDFVITKEFDYYKITIVTDLELFGQVDELEQIINNVMPCNMVVVSDNRIPCDSSGFALIGGGVCFVHNFFITNDFKENYTVQGVADFGGGILGSQKYFITNDSKEKFNISGENEVGSGVVISQIVGINS